MKLSLSKCFFEYRQQRIMQIDITYFSNRYGNWHKDKTKEVTQKNVPRLIVYIMGGATYSEFRTGYEVTNDKKNWEVIIGKCV